jgi:hypothetical protein
VAYYQEAEKMGDARAAEALKRINVYQMAKQVIKPQGNFVEFTKYAAKQLVNEPNSAPLKVSAELRYLSALDALNHGQLDIAVQALNNIIKEYPYFVPAKQLYMQIQKQNQSV